MIEHELRTVDRRFYRTMLVMFFVISVFVFIAGMVAGAYMYAVREPIPCDVLLRVDRTIGEVYLRCIREAFVIIINGGKPQ